MGVDREAGGCPDPTAPGDDGTEAAPSQEDVVGAGRAQSQGRQLAGQHRLARLDGQLGLTGGQHGGQFAGEVMVDEPLSLPP